MCGRRLLRHLISQGSSTDKCDPASSIGAQWSALLIVLGAFVSRCCPAETNNNDTEKRYFVPPVRRPCLASHRPLLYALCDTPRYACIIHRKNREGGVATVRAPVNGNALRGFDSDFVRVPIVAVASRNQIATQPALERP
ncbi:hypothetical protein HETIRDRAFT_105702 [Heterobasidion irregulare TC 32-1]|uniref:Uncharacterized protein n=1 Tax=Heterobasidion irregulare (strain TC 32-1) TaxID=747525 RepID=W4JU66_HETIT|nr:uncharacterized protein HETIRDRAFT_105702 [Heterobasidion irregulare TC 32-1]ETW77097.1 hypothetical protein HETIRDRAFT_105702 [Heterobasidion irregulare TC 32-1]